MNLFGMRVPDGKGMEGKGMEGKGGSKSLRDAG
jgi:hypothetical protein